MLRIISVFIQNFIAWSYLIIYLKLGLFDGSRSQHFFINFEKHSGVFFGIVGLISLFKTYIETCKPVKSIFYAFFTFERRLSWSYLPQYDTVTENISFFRIFLTCNNLWSHPLVCTYLSCHVILQSFCPSEICKFYFITIIKQKVQTFKISMNNWRWACM